MENKFEINDLSNVYKNINHLPQQHTNYDFAFKLNEKDEIYYSKEFKEWLIILDSFPMPRRSFKWSLPVKSYSDFEALFRMAGIELIRTEITPFEKAIADSIEGSTKTDSLQLLIDWQIEEWTEKAEGIARIIGFDPAGNKYEGSACVIGTLLDGKIERIEEFEMVQRNTSRPDLTFITRKSFDFNKDFEYAEWFVKLTSEQKLIMRRFEFKLPELLMIAEMFYDMHIGKEDSPMFKLASETLNAGKP